MSAKETRDRGGDAQEDVSDEELEAAGELGVEAEDEEKETTTPEKVAAAAPAPVAVATEAPSAAKPSFGSFGQPWGMTPQTLRFGT